MQSIMELNKETASRLWVKQFGKKQKAFDFAGREIARAAYNDRNSDYGWNVDHILPESRGGKTADHNLICCSIQTNDEKADRFPSFKANGQLFEIHRRENHYEIMKKSQNNDHKENVDKNNDTINFFDAAQGLKCWEKAPQDQKDIFVGYVKIKLAIANNGNELVRFKNFIQALFPQCKLFETRTNGMIDISELDYYPTDKYNIQTYCFTLVNFDMPDKSDSENLLSNCIVLNSYHTYFIKKTGIVGLKIRCGMNCYPTTTNMTDHIHDEIIKRNNTNFSDDLSINDLIKINTSANDKIKEEQASSRGVRIEDVTPLNDRWYAYNYTYIKLSENLRKRIDN